MATPSRSNSRIPILIGSDRQIMRTGLEMIFRAVPDFEVVDQGTFANLSELRRQFSSAVILLEFCGSDSALPVVGKLMRSDPECSAILLTTNRNTSFVRSILAIGVKGYVLKTANSSELYEAVRHVYAGHQYIDPRLSDDLSDVLFTPGKRRVSPRKPSLSKRELEVLRAVAHGFTSRQIAEELGVTEKTVCTYRSRKLDLRSRSDLVQYAIATGLLDALT